MKLKKAYKGMHTWRFKDNPLEKRFAQQWQECNSSPTTEFRTLGYLFSKENQLEFVSERDALVAATVIQWLGSPVGTWFLADALGVPVEQIRSGPVGEKGGCS